MTERMFTVPGKPVGKGRPRFSAAAGYVKAYTPAKTANYENWVRLCYQEAYRDMPQLEGPVCMVLEAVFAPAKSWPKKRRALALSGHLRPVTKPDADNLIKAVADALNGIAYRDDVQVVSVACDKRYGETEGLTVTLRPLQSEECGG